MDPCPFVRLIIESLALKLPSSSSQRAGSDVYPSSTPCYAKLKLKNFPSQNAIVPLSAADSSLPDSSSSSAGFHLDPTVLRRLSAKPVIVLKISVYMGRMGRACGVPSGGKKLGSVKLNVDVSGAQSKSSVYQNGWLKLGGDHQSGSSSNNGGGAGGAVVGCGFPPKLHVVVRSEPDPRFVFQFGGEPECSPVVFQIQDQERNIRQPVFSCKFSADRNNRSRSLPTDFTISNKKWMRTLSGDSRKKTGRERKGWMIIIYDLSGSSVAAASMITPFVPSPGSDRVSRSNSGAWLILRPNNGSASSSSISSWKPWGRLEAWRERGTEDGLGYKFELVGDSSGSGSGLTSGGLTIAEGTISVKKGGEFCIDNTMEDSALRKISAFRGFVMGSSVEGEGKVSKPTVQVGVRHVTCMADAALFVALSAALDLSMDACRLFSHKLRKEFLPADELTYDHRSL